MDGNQIRGFMAYQARKKNPVLPETQVAHIIANKVILRAMQEGTFIQELLAELAEDFPRPFNENDTLNALKKIADGHRHKVSKDEYTA